MSTMHGRCDLCDTPTSGLLPGVDADPPNDWVCSNCQELYPGLLMLRWYNSESSGHEE